MNILITGGAGFIGTFTKKLLKMEGHKIVILDNLQSGSRENLRDDEVFIEGDIRDSTITQKLLPYDIEVIIHLAAQTSVPISIKDPLNDLSINIEGTIKVLQVAKELGIKKFIFASSAAVYGDNESLPIQEEAVLQPTSPYGISKMSAEKYIESFCKLHDITYIIFRFANVFGPKQSKDGEGGVIKIFFDCMMKGVPPQIFGDGTQTRDFIFVEDIARAHVAALKEVPSGIYNVSTNTEISVNELINWIKETTQVELSPIYTEERAGDIYKSCLDNSKIKTNLGWEPVYSVLEGIKETYDSLK
ncbi:NAD-dependent epimerase/dehydratase family protein [Bacillus sp. JJ1521]|uniref:NAD-dependent epimerase/dehydratase family protein n=1 Tax=Bacillus sp. JJ1521 TaxID=3122957 RepID=UPI003000D85C